MPPPPLRPELLLKIRLVSVGELSYPLPMPPTWLDKSPLKPSALPAVMVKPSSMALTVQAEVGHHIIGIVAGVARHSDIAAERGDNAGPSPAAPLRLGAIA